MREFGGGTQVDAVLPASVDVAEIAVEEDDGILERAGDDEEDAARVRLLAGDDAMASINRAMASLMLQPMFIGSARLQRSVRADMFREVHSTCLGQNDWINLYIGFQTSALLND